MLIGVTGGIGCGKTMVARLMSELLTAPYYSSDEICRELLRKDHTGYRVFVQFFGTKFLNETGNIDRSLLRKHIFTDTHSRQKLESILHPLVRDRILKDYENVPTGTPVIAEVPLLFECGWERDFDEIVCVVASREVVVQRIMTRDLVSQEDAGRIINVQMDIEEKAARSNWIVDNDGDHEQTVCRVSEVAELIRNRSGKK